MCSAQAGDTLVTKSTPDWELMGDTTDPHPDPGDQNRQDWEEGGRSWELRSKTQPGSQGGHPGGEAIGAASNTHKDYAGSGKERDRRGEVGVAEGEDDALGNRRQRRV